MPQIFGSVEQSTVENGVQRTRFMIPAFSKTAAKQRGKINARIKGMSNYRVERVTGMGSADVPGQTRYEVEVTSGS